MRNLLTFYLLLFVANINAQQTEADLNFYFKNQTFDKDIPTPKSFLGWEIGQWHIDHFQLVNYLKTLAEKSDKAAFVQIGKSYEDRSTNVLFISSAKNIRNLEAIRTKRLEAFKNKSSKDIPVVIYQGNSIHGNEPSGGNAAALYAYYLLAAQNQEVKDILDNVVILLDPCYNPDGFNRFASWVNSHKSYLLDGNGKDREYNEAWPRGRTNHYWFDLNRDWLPLRHPESRGRIDIFHKWKPEILTDHHEMGTNATFFFQPGVPGRTNPITPNINQELTKKIASYHKKALDQIGSLYFTEESYDDFYYGKGSTYPDIQGSIGILFEQASSRGHLQQTQHGLMSFAFTIRNQLTTQISTSRAALGLKKELLDFKANFVSNALKEISKSSTKGYTFAEDKDYPRINEFIDILLRHKIEVNKITDGTTIQGKKYENAYYVSLNQDQSRTVRAIFETSTKFQDSIFYDISAWTFPLSFNLAYQKANKTPSGLNKITEKPADNFGLIDCQSDSYAFIYKWDSHFAPAGLYYLLKKKIKVKAITRYTTYHTSSGKQNFNSGDIIISTQMQKYNSEELLSHLKEAAKIGKTQIYGVTTGDKVKGNDVGSRAYDAIQLPKIALVVGDGVRSYDAGEVWHLFDQYYQIPITKIDTRNSSYVNLEDFSHVILADGNYGKLKKKLKDYALAGGNIIAYRNTVKWLADNEFTKAKFKELPKPDQSGRYKDVSNTHGAMVIGGAIFEMNIDKEHPIFFGYDEDKIPTFRNTRLFMIPSKNKFVNPAKYTSEPLLSGYIHEKNLDSLKNSSAIHIGKLGSGQVISLVDNTNFRAFWWGTNKILANTVFFGHLIHYRAKE